MIYILDNWFQSFKTWRATRMIRAMEHVNRSKFKYIASVPAKTEWLDAGYTETCYYILYENGYGQKKFEFNPSSWLVKDPKKHGVYSKIIVPWLNNHYTSDQLIERYGK